MDHFIEVLLPLPLERNFTYAISPAEVSRLRIGMRVAVPFGKSKLYTALVVGLNTDPPTAYEAKRVYEILDEKPLVSKLQLKFWKWMASYYMCTPGEVFRTAVPGILLLESETRVSGEPQWERGSADLDPSESLVLQALQHQSTLRVSEISSLVERKNALPLVSRMLKRGMIRVEETLSGGYRPKEVRFLRLHPAYRGEEALEELLKSLSRAPKQTEVLLHLFQLQQGVNKPIKSTDLEKQTGTSRSVIKTLIDKEVLEQYTLIQDRIGNQEGRPDQGLAVLNPEQNNALTEIQAFFKTPKPVLLYGVTASGKTEIYSHLIAETLRAGKQVLYLVPEIALTTQLTHRMEELFGSRVAAFHSRQSQPERAEIWYHLQEGGEKASVVLGARSALFLPFEHLGLILIDEEHENSYKQFDPAPRYHARDAAILLASYWDARVLLGSATPSVESYHNAKTGKYGLVEIRGRYGGVLLPEMELINLADAYRKKQMAGHFSHRLRDAITETLEQKRQVILFQNRRGFSPIVECLSCGHVPGCPNCDVSLTYHQQRGQLRCHYCGFHRHLESECQACGMATLDTKGLGTEQVTTELAEMFPETKTSRMDLDTTRGKHAFSRIIEAFEAREVQMLVGTQMVTKGLDFGNVGLVGIMNADTL
ncbi:MAG: primosomal protein N', partial [Robiginitalea sp.]|uniref:replication restart helicase PriA n=1 Tax=Robiginitalea sp. TaxID=1902411 RepID=UPI003C74EB18